MKRSIILLASALFFISSSSKGIKNILSPENDFNTNRSDFDNSYDTVPPFFINRG